jgi:hypothetical protein
MPDRVIRTLTGEEWVPGIHSGRNLPAGGLQGQAWDVATQGTLRYDPISRLRPPDNLRFRYWPWQFPDKIDCPAACFNALQVENFRFCPFWQIALEVNPGGWPVTRSIRAPILVCSRRNAAIVSGPLVLIESYRSSPCVVPNVG